jgi:small subunit ribosomal protein S8
MNTDPIADMLTRIRNTAMLNRTTVEVPYSKFKAAVADILLQSGYLSDVSETGDSFKVLKLELAAENGELKVKQLSRISKPGRRLYAKADEIPTPLSGRGLVIISTSGGVMSGSEAKKRGLGGELICQVQ